MVPSMNTCCFQTTLFLEKSELQDSFYFKMSKIGVLLSGSVSKLIPNLEDLPPQQPPINACNFIAEGFNSAIKGIVNDNQVSQITEKINCYAIIMSTGVKYTELNNSGIIDDNICTNDMVVFKLMSFIYG